MVPTPTSADGSHEVLPKLGIKMGAQLPSASLPVPTAVRPSQPYDHPFFSNLFPSLVGSFICEMDTGGPGSLQSPWILAGQSLPLYQNNTEESDHQKQNQSLCQAKNFQGLNFCSQHLGEKFIQGRAGGSGELPVPQGHTVTHGFPGSPSDPRVVNFLMLISFLIGEKRLHFHLFSFYLDSGS